MNSFATIARSTRPAASLSEATGGDLDRSVQHRELKRPHGFGDELRAVLAGGGSAAWGAITLLRASDRAHFAPGDAAVVASVSGSLAEGLRRAMLRTALSEGAPGEEDAGLALLAADNAIVRADAAAEAWIAELGAATTGSALPPVIAAVASRVRAIADGHAAPGAIARARVRTPSGRWLVVRGSTLGDDAGTAVILEPARPHELAPLIADAYGLTERERAVTQLVAQGFATDAIARRLHLSPWTAQDHLKAIFEKTGVGTRGELVAQLFFEHYAPRLTHWVS